MGIYLYLVRHGQTEANAGNFHAGYTDSPLTALGREQAAASAPILADIPFDTVFSSDLCRAKDTCAIMLPDKTPILRTDLREVNAGELEMQHRVAARERYGDVHLNATKLYDYSAFGGETYAAFSGRVISFLEEVATGDYGKHVAAFCHGGIIEAAVRYVLKCADQRPPMAVTNCSVTLLYFNGEKWTVRNFNCVPTLPR